MPKETQYTNNPLKIAVDGTKMLFQKAPMAAIILAVLSALGASKGFNESTPTGPKDMPGEIVTTGAAVDPAVVVVIVIVAAVILFGILIIGSILTGIFAYTAAEVAKGREVTFRQAVNATFDRFWSFVGLQLLTIVKVLLWSLLFVIPGIIMAFRYSLANLSFFDDKKKFTGNTAIKDSLELTKGAWLTTFASQTFLNIITLGSIGPIVDTGSKAMLYRQFSALQQTNTPKPKAHALSWVTLGFTLLIAIIATIFLTYAITHHILPTIK